MSSLVMNLNISRYVSRNNISIYGPQTISEDMFLEMGHKLGTGVNIGRCLPGHDVLLFHNEMP